MTALNGQITALGLYGPDAEDNWSIDLSGFDIAVYLDLDTGESGDLSMHATRAVVDAIANVQTRIATINHHFVDDFYNRIHLYENPLALGNLLADVAENVYVWNAYFTSKTLYALNETGTEGIEITEPAAAPTVFAPLEERTYVVSVVMEGPPSIDAEVDFVFDDTFTLVITGSRVVIWRWRPDLPITERLEWLTNILTTREGEQRIALRDCPRQVFDMTFTKRPHEFAEIKTTAAEWAFRLWGLPIWTEMVKVGVVLSDAVAIDFATSYADYRHGGLALIWETPDVFEAVEIATVRADGLDLVYGVSQDYTAAWVMPLRLAHTPEGVRITRPHPSAAQLSARFLVTDNVDLAATAYSQYRDYDVLTDGDILVGDVTEHIARPVIMHDNGQGPIVVETAQDWTRFSRTLGKAASGASARWAWRCWLHSRYGRQAAFWLPTWNQDMTVVADIGASDVLIGIDPIGLTLFATMPVDIMIKLTDGTIFYRRVSDATTGSGIETITIDAALGQEVAIDDIAMVCLMNLVRLNADTIELRHTLPARVSSSVPVMEVAE